MEFAVSFLRGNEKEGYEPDWATINLEENLPLYPSNNNSPSVWGVLVTSLRENGTLKEKDKLIVLSFTPNIITVPTYRVPQPQQTEQPSQPEEKGQPEKVVLFNRRNSEEDV